MSCILQTRRAYYYAVKIRQKSLSLYLFKIDDE